MQCRIGGEIKDKLCRIGGEIKDELCRIDGEIKDKLVNFAPSFSWQQIHNHTTNNLMTPS